MAGVIQSDRSQRKALIIKRVIRHFLFQVRVTPLSPVPGGSPGNHARQVSRKVFCRSAGDDIAQYIGQNAAVPDVCHFNICVEFDNDWKCGGFSVLLSPDRQLAAGLDGVQSLDGEGLTARFREAKDSPGLNGRGSTPMPTRVSIPGILLFFSR